MVNCASTPAAWFGLPYALDCSCWHLRCSKDVMQKNMLLAHAALCKQQNRQHSDESDTVNHNCMHDWNPVMQLSTSLVYSRQGSSDVVCAIDKLPSWLDTRYAAGSHRSM